MEEWRESESRLFWCTGQDKRQQNKLGHGEFQLNIKGEIIIIRVVKHWTGAQRTPGPMPIASPSFQILRRQLDKATSSLMQLALLCGRG